MWRAIRIHESMISRIHYIAAYQVAPVRAITHVADVDHIEPWKDTQKYAVYFKGPAQAVEPIRWVPNGKVMAPQNSRYTSIAKLRSAKTLDDVF
jgi:hypothetical protein